MNRAPSYLILLALSVVTSTHTCRVAAQQTSGSVVFDSVSMPSKILDGPRNFAIYLPPGYYTSEREYPVLYLLHGSGDDQTGWIQFGEVQRIADQAIAAGTATPMIIVMPDANTGRRGYFNDIRGEWNYEDFFFKELMPYVEPLYRIKAEKRYRAIAGLSMGGGGAFMYALHHPELFSTACPLSASVGPLDFKDAKKRYSEVRNVGEDTEPSPLTDDQIETYLDRYSALRLVEKSSVDEMNGVRWYIDCGDDDFLYEGNSLVHIAMKKRNVKHEYRVRDGEHNWTYWRTALPEVLSFVSDAFQQR